MKNTKTTTIKDKSCYLNALANVLERIEGWRDDYMEYNEETDTYEPVEKDDWRFWSYTVLEDVISQIEKLA